jgi:hypothetical protein
MQASSLLLVGLQAPAAATTVGSFAAAYGAGGSTAIAGALARLQFLDSQVLSLRAQANSSWFLLRAASPLLEELYKCESVAHASSSDPAAAAAKCPPLLAACNGRTSPLGVLGKLEQIQPEGGMTLGRCFAGGRSSSLAPSVAGLLSAPCIEGCGRLVPPHACRRPSRRPAVDQQAVLIVLGGSAAPQHPRGPLDLQQHELSAGHAA